MGHQEMVTYNAQATGSGNLVITITHAGDGSVRSLTLDPMVASYERRRKWRRDRVDL